MVKLDTHRELFGKWALPILVLYAIMACAPNGRDTLPESSSPNGKIKVFLTLDENRGNIHFNTLLGNDTVVANAPLGIALADRSHRFLDSLRFVGYEHRLIDEKYEMPMGKRKKRHNYCNESSYIFKNKSGESLQVVVRVFNDGIAVRYKLENPSESIVTKERSGYGFKSMESCWSIPYSSADERIFEKHVGTGQLQEEPLSLPVLVTSHSGNWMLATEADVSNFPLTGGTFKNDTLHYIFPGPKKGANTVGPNFESPWRVLILGDQLATIVESCIVDHLAPPTHLEDTSWIRPGVTSFPWWGDNLANSSPETLKKYIDLSAVMGWEYLEFDLPLINSPARAVDDWKTTPWVKDVVGYGLKKGVKCYGWDEFGNLNTPEKRKDIFERYNELGIVGCKVDFINSYSQEARKTLEDIIRDAADYKLMLSFHGAQSPRGFARTYPHIMTYEAVKGSEYYLSINGAQGLTPYHNATLPFTRNVLGSMDYVPVAFSTGLRRTTAGHELALAVVFESGWQGMCDVPEAYLESPGKAFLQDLPAAWDETRLLAGYPGEFCVMARRSGKNWYIGGINGAASRNLSIDVSSILSKPIKTSMYKDREGEKDELTIEEIELSRNEPLEVMLKSNGGFAFVIPGD